jgi:hypothetical protein
LLGVAFHALHDLLEDQDDDDHSEVYLNILVRISTPALRDWCTGISIATAPASVEGCYYRALILIIEVRHDFEKIRRSIDFPTDNPSPSIFWAISTCCRLKVVKRNR